MVFIINIQNVVAVDVRNIHVLVTWITLQGDFAKYGCKYFEDVNTFDTWKPKR